MNPDGKDNIDALVHSLKLAKKAKRGAALLVGAGCSKTAGIPLANEFIKLIKAEHSFFLTGLNLSTYMQYMNALAPDIRRDFIKKHIDSNRGKLNWAHICLAELVKNGFISRVLTTNFDPLIMRACSLLNFYPAIYDFSMYNGDSVPNMQHIHEPAIIYLHGQSTGFELKNTDHEIKEHLSVIRHVVEDTNKKKVPWIVVGYSGQADHVTQAFENIKQFDSSLYWICYKDSPAGENAQRLIQKKFAHSINGYDADFFFIELCKKLDCLPTIIPKPFTHLKSIYEGISAVQTDRFP